MSKVQAVEFRDLMVIEMGQSPKAEYVNEQGKGIPLLNGPAEFTVRHPVPKQYTTKGNRFAEPGDILFCVRGSTTGRMNWADQKYAIGRGLAAISHKEGAAFNSFIKGIIEYNLKGLLGGSMGSVFPNLTKEQLYNYKCIAPDLEGQKSISNILSALDSKIELNNRINAELEALAKTIYDYWFMQFDFPISSGYAASVGQPELEGKPYKSSGGEMVWNEDLRREVPKGWEVKKITTFIEVKDGTHDSPKKSTEGKYLITSKHLAKSGIDFSSAYLISEGDYQSVNRRSKVDTGDILISMIGTIGTTYYVQDSQIEFAIKNMGLFKTSQNPELADYIYSYLDSAHGKQYFLSSISGSIQNYLTLGVLRHTPLLVPSKAALEKYNSVARSLYQKIHVNNEENQELASLRDWLLPMLMNGQVTVGEALKEYEQEGEVGIAAEERINYKSDNR